MNSQYWFLLVYPLIIFIVIIAGCKKISKERSAEEFLSLENTKKLRGATALGIVLHHCTQLVTNYGSKTSGLIGALNYMGILFTGIFFFLSGYGLYLSYKNKENYLDGFLTKRLTGILIPYFFANVICLLVNIIFAEMKYTSIQVLTSLTGYTLVNPNAWFVVELIFLYIFFYIAFKKCKSEKTAMRVVAIATAVLIIISLFLGHDRGSLGGHWFMGEWWYNSTIMFVVGMYFAKYINKIVKYMNDNYTRLLIFSIGFFAVSMAADYFMLKYCGYYVETDSYRGNLEKFLTLIVQTYSVVSFGLLILLINLRVKFGNPILNFISKMSFELYLMHGMVVYFFEGSLRRETLPYMLYFLFVFALSLVIAFLFKLLDDLFIRLWKGRKAFYANVPDSFEGKQMWKRKAKRWRLVKICFFAAMAVLLVLCVKETIYKYYVPYRDANDEREALSKAAVGDIVEFGEYDLDWYTQGMEKIPWIVAQKDGDRVLLVAQYAMFAECFNNKYAVIQWSTSSLRKSLNYRWFFEAFSKYEQKMIDVTMHKDLFGEDVMDRVFIPSVEEALKIFKTEEERKFEPTPIAMKRGMYVNIGNEMTWWWLRDSCENRYKVKTVFADGKVVEDGDYVSIPSGAVRPMIWVNTNN